MPAPHLSRPRVAATALLAFAASILPGGHATAQPPGLKMLQPLQSARPAPVPAPATPTPVNIGVPKAAPAPVQVTLTFPSVPDAAFVAVRGTDGEVRYFPVKGGRKELASRVIVVRPGERVHIQLPPANPK